MSDQAGSSQIDCRLQASEEPAQGKFASPPRAVATGLAVLLAWVFGFALAGAFVGAVVGRLTERPDEILADLDPLVGAVFGFPIGGVVGLVLFGLWASSRRPAPPR